MKIVKNLWLGFSSGVLIGLVISLFFNYLEKADQYYPSSPAIVQNFGGSVLNAFVYSIVIWGFVGLLFASTAMIFQLDSWSITKMTVVHFVISCGGMLPLAIAAKWFPLTALNVMTFTLEFGGIYLVIWGCCMLHARGVVRQLNQKVNK